MMSDGCFTDTIRPLPAAGSEEGRAFAAVAAAFPEEIKNANKCARSIEEPWSGFWAFFAELAGPIFVAKPSGAGFAVIKLGITPFHWSVLKPGISPKERHGTFWIALARQFAAKKFSAPIQDFSYVNGGLDACGTSLTIRQVLLREVSQQRRFVTICFDGHEPTTATFEEEPPDAA